MSNVNPLAEHHRHLDRVFEALICRAQGGDCLSLRREWSLFEGELLRHLELEEKELLPELARRDPDEAEAIRSEHERIRAELMALGVNLDLHLLRASAVEDLVGQLRAHARREERVLYPLAREILGADRWAALPRTLAGHGAPASHER